MENRRILNWKNLSVIRKSQIIAATTGAFVTVIMNIPWGIDVGKYNSIADIGFQFWLLLGKPTWVIWQAFGNPPGHHLLFVVLEIVINSFLCLIAGTLIGWIVRENKKR